MIYYIDDKKNWRDKFFENHHKEFEIYSFGIDTEFKDQLVEAKGKEGGPDIILIDLFHPRKHTDIDKQKKAEDKGNKAIELLEKAINDSKLPIYEAWEPYGFEMLKFAREHYPNTPIAIYTQQGLSVVEDTDLKTVSELKGEWLLKGRDPIYEKFRLEDMLNQNEALKNSEIKRLKMKRINLISMVLLTIIVFALLLFAWLINDSVQLYQFIAAFIVPIFLAFVQIYISHFEKKT